MQRQHHELGTARDREVRESVAVDGLQLRPLRLLAIFAVAVLAAATIAVATSSSADAAIVRPGKQAFQVDVLLDGGETQRAATSLWGTSTVCLAATTAAITSGSAISRSLAGRWAAGGVVGGIAGGAGCMMVFGTCAAQAYHHHKWAGMTITPTGYWCWKY